MSALVPVKALDRCKSRLSEHLSGADRRRLQVGMLDRVLGALGNARLVSDVTVVTADPEVAALAVSHRASVLSEPHSSGLNPAVVRGCASLAGQGARRILVLPADLPLFDGESCDAFLAAAAAVGGYGIAPDLVRDGTNALTFPAADSPVFHFGPGSFQRHRRQFPATAAEVRRIELALDLDRPCDLARLAEFCDASELKGATG